jgi:hypothetical protein
MLAISMIKPIATGPHSGAVIHHHDQAITPVSLRTRNTMNRTPTKPMPEVVELFIMIGIRNAAWMLMCPRRRYVIENKNRFILVLGSKVK